MSGTLVLNFIYLNRDEAYCQFVLVLQSSIYFLPLN